MITVFFCLVLAMIAAIIAPIVLALLTGSGVLHAVARTKQNVQEQQRSNVYCGHDVMGEITDIRQLHAIAGNTGMRSYNVAVVYQTETGERTALFGMDTEAPIAFCVGDRVQLHIFPAPLTPADPATLDRTLTACGLIPEDGCRFRKLGGVTVDEAAIAVFSSDYHTLKQDYMIAASDPPKGNAARHTVSGILLVLGIAGALFLLYVVIEFSQFIDSLHGW